MLECAKFCLNWPSGSTEEDKNVKKFTNDKQIIKKLTFKTFQLGWALNLIAVAKVTKWGAPLDLTKNIVRVSVLQQV